MEFLLCSKRIYSSFGCSIIPVFKYLSKISAVNVAGCPPHTISPFVLIRNICGIEETPYAENVLSLLSSATEAFILFFAINASTVSFFSSETETKRTLLLLNCSTSSFNQVRDRKPNQEMWCWWISHTIPSMIRCCSIPDYWRIHLLWCWLSPHLKVEWKKDLR